MNLDRWDGWKVAALAIVLFTVVALFRPEKLGPIGVAATSIINSLKGLVPQ